MTPAITVKNVNKSFKVYQDKGHMLKERVLHWDRNKYEKRVVLNNISFEIGKGESVGLIGCNGCGKSTTLKLLTKIIYPDSGNISLNGRVSSLLELGAGFHPDLSGIENIYINASIFGLNRKAIEARIDSIIDFSELKEYINNPVRTYSSGMYMKLAFSVAINVDADILLIDENLAVGDVNFQAKCLKKLQEIKRNGTTIVLVSHSMDQIREICNRCIWLRNGEVFLDGDTADVSFQYLRYMNQIRKKQVENEPVKTEQNAEWAKRFGSGEVKIISLDCLNHENKPISTLNWGEPFSIRFNVKREKPIGSVWFGISIIRNDGVVCYGTNTLADNNLKYNISSNATIKISFENISLMPGIYYIDICVGKSVNEFVDYWQSAKTIEIFDIRKDIGLVKLDHHWSVDTR